MPSDDAIMSAARAIEVRDAMNARPFNASIRLSAEGRQAMVSIPRDITDSELVMVVRTLLGDVLRDLRAETEPKHSGLIA